jgi:SpoIID/LytB domain protein
VQAQAVAARTYAANSIGSASKRDWQICDTTSCQVYGGVAAEDARANAAVTHTAGQILTYQGAPAFTQFSASNGGWTSAGSVPYLTARADPYDGYSGNAVHSWTTTIDTRVLEKRYPSLGALQRIIVTERDGHGAWAGRAWTVVLDGNKADVTIGGDTFRGIYGLKSSWYAFAPTPIIARWRALGASHSVLGTPKAREVGRTGGAVQAFTKGRIYAQTKIGPRELYGQVLTAYAARGGVSSKLGWPTSAVRKETGGTWASFQHGEIHATASGVRVVYH